MKNIIEIGVNTGTDTDMLLKKYPDANYYGFEPTRELLAQALWPRFGEPRVHMLPFAVHSENTFMEFHVAGQGDWGCSSLYKFDPDIHAKWPGRPDFKESHSYKVPCIRMDTFLETWNVQGDIEYAWIDAQGNDLVALQSFGKHIERLKAGKLECALNIELYTGTINTFENVQKFLTDNGYMYSMTPDPTSAECNVDFWRE